VKKEKPAKGWWSWWTGKSVESEDDEEIVIVDETAVETAANLPQWLLKLKPEDQMQLTSAIGYQDSVPVVHSSEVLCRKKIQSLFQRININTKKHNKL